MTQGHAIAGVAIAVNRLIVELQNEICRIERCCAVRIHDQMRDRLIREKIGSAIQLQETFSA